MANDKSSVEKPSAFCRRRSPLNSGRVRFLGRSGGPSRRARDRPVHGARRFRRSAGPRPRPDREQANRLANAYAQSERQETERPWMGPRGVNVKGRAGIGRTGCRATKVAGTRKRVGRPFPAAGIERLIAVWLFS